MDTKMEEEPSIYGGYERGITFDIGGSDETCPASKEYLLVLIDDIVAIRDEFILDHKSIPTAVAKTCLDLFFDEYARLSMHPELFETPEQEAMFHDEVKKYVQQILGVISGWKTITRLEKEFRTASTADAKSEIRPSYVARLGPWSQFLKNGAPGSGVDRDGLIITGLREPDLLQIIPSGGRALLLAWSTHQKAFERMLGVVRNANPERPGDARRRYNWRIQTKTLHCPNTRFADADVSTIPGAGVIPLAKLNEKLGVLQPAGRGSYDTSPNEIRCMVVARWKNPNFAGEDLLKGLPLF